MSPLVVETPDLHGAFPRLNDSQLGAVAACAERRPTRAGEALFREGERPYDFLVVTRAARLRRRPRGHEHLLRGDAHLVNAIETNPLDARDL